MEERVTSDVLDHVPLIGDGFFWFPEDADVSYFLRMAEIKSINHPVAEGIVFKSTVMNGPSFKVLNNTLLLKEKRLMKHVGDYYRYRYADKVETTDPSTFDDGNGNYFVMSPSVRRTFVSHAVAIDHASNLIHNNNAEEFLIVKVVGRGTEEAYTRRIHRGLDVLHFASRVVLVRLVQG